MASRFASFLRALPKMQGGPQGGARDSDLEFQVDLSQSVAGIELVNPVMTAAGTSGYGAELSAFFDISELGAVVVKSLASFVWPGNPGPRLIPLKVGMLNSVGLQGPGISKWITDYLPGLEEHRAKVIVSIWGRSVDEFGEAARQVGAIKDRVLAIEANLSCPNLEDRSKLFAHSVEMTRLATEAVVDSGVTTFVKLSPNTHLTTEVATAAMGAGASAVTVCNTLLGMEIDPLARRAVLGGVGGGLSGSALFPVALRAVFDLHGRAPEIPIVGVGGISNGRDALAMLMAGASAVQVGTASFADPRAAKIVLDDLTRYCARAGIAKVREIVGAAGVE